MIRENYVLLGSRGILKGLYIKDVVATSSDADVIHVFADFDTSTESTSYRAIARVRRPDGELYGPTLLPLTVAEFDAPEDAIAIGIDENAIVGPDVVTGKFQVACRDLTLSQQMLELTGEVGVTIVYQEVDSLGAYVRDIATSYVVVTVRDAIPTLATEEEYSDLLEIFLPRDLGDLTNGVQPTVTDKILVRQGGATKLITVGQLNDLLETGITVFKKVAYDTIAPAETISIGETRWNAEVETLETRVGNDLYLQHGQELYFKCKNAGGVNIPNGTPVYITGASGSSPNFYIARASSSDYVKTSRCIGLTTEDIYAGAWGKVCVIGIVNGLKTNTFEVGDVVYLGAGGIITNVRPTTNVLALGVVIQKSPTDGRIALRPIFFPRPEDLSTVHYSGLANGDILVKDANGWTNYALANKANVSDLTAGTITVKKAEQDQYGRVIDETYLKISGENAMEGNLNLGTNKIINLVDGVANQDGATMKNIDTKITAHDGSETAHLYIRALIEALEQEIERLDGRGKSYGEIAYTTAQLLALSQAILDDTITDAVALGHGGTGYTPSNGDLVYDTGVGDGVSYHEWEFNGMHWVDNGLIGYSKASNTIYGMIKGDGTYLSVVSGLVQVLKSNYADKIGTSGGSYTYAQLLSALSDRYTKAEVDALLDALKTAFGWEETDLGDYSTAIDLSSYDLVVLKYESEQGANDISITEIFSPSAYAQTDVISLVIHSAEDDSVLGAGSFLKGATTWSYVNSVGTNTLSMRGYKIKPIQAENVVYDNSTSGLTADDVNGAIDEIKEDLDLKEIASNKVTAFQETPDDTHYASEKLVKDSLDAKVDKVTGKGLSANDFTNEKSAQIETNKTDIATNLANQALTDSRQDLRLATVEENLRKSMANEIQGTASGTSIISLGKDVANAPLQVKVEGGLIPALQNLVTNGDFSGGTTGWSANDGTLIASDNILTHTITGTLTAGSRVTKSITANTNDIIYYKFDFKTEYSNLFRFTFDGTNFIILGAPYSTLNTWSNIKGGYKLLANATQLSFNYYHGAGNVGAKYYFRNVLSFNLTASHGVTETSGTAYDNAVADIEAVLALNGGYISSTPIHAVGMNKRVRSVGKNLFDISKKTNGYWVFTNGNIIVGANDCVSDYTRVKSSTNYVLSGRGAGYGSGVAFYTITKIFISHAYYNNNVSFTTPANCAYIRFNGLVIDEQIQLELGSTATTYEPYVSSDLFLQANAVGYKLPNGVADKTRYDNGKYVLDRYVQQSIFNGAVSESWSLNATYTATLRFTISVNNGGLLVNASSNNGYSTFAPLVDSTVSLETEGWLINANALYIVINKSRLSTNDVAGLRTYLASNNLAFIYQLATPLLATEILASGNLNGYQNATVYIDDVMQDADIYATNATITNTDYPIKTLEKIVKINSDGSQTNLAVSGATVASGGLSFTHSSLTSGDKVWFSYVYDVANLFKSTSIITFYDNKFVIADTANGKIYKWAVTSTNGVGSIALTEV